MRIERYSQAKKTQWNDFLALSKNGHFFFNRDYIEYHQDRFKDHSLMVYSDEKLIAILPANIKDNTLYSHSGLTFGTFCTKPNLSFQKTLKSFKAVLDYLQTQQIHCFILKCIPEFYCSTPSGEIEYLLSKIEAKEIRRDLTSTIQLKGLFTFKPSKKTKINKCKKLNLQIRQSNDIIYFWSQILIPNLRNQHDVSPVHTADEMELLIKRFPKNISLYCIYLEDEMLAGTILFKNKTTINAQYISATAKGKELNVLDLLFHELISNTFSEHEYFNFGISTFNQGQDINHSLLHWKEGFGARSYSQKFFQIDTSKGSLIEKLLQ